MSDGQLCPCAHGCNQYARNGGPCPSCLAGWHSSVCDSFTTDTVNGRLFGVDLASSTTLFCGRCGGQKAGHR